ncbi:MAG: Ig-like domain-containing protein [Lachnospiraceae bacterium]|nr:Ig-like domain-containing protein [Lachnospiraceae bacterium]
MNQLFRYTMLTMMAAWMILSTKVSAAIVDDVSSVSVSQEVVEEPKIEIESEKVTLKKGATKELDVDITTHEEDGNDYEIQWISTNKKVATVSSNGKVKAKKAGTATIKAKLSGTDVESKCKVIVKTIKGRKLKYGASSDRKVTVSSLKSTGGTEFSDNAGNTYTKGKKVGNFVITGYCTKCNSGSARATSSGKTATAGITVAVNSKQIPLGTKLIIGDHVYIAQDRHGNRAHSKVIDVFFGTRHGSECFLKNIPVYYAK